MMAPEETTNASFLLTPCGLNCKKCEFYIVSHPEMTMENGGNQEISEDLARLRDACQASGEQLFICGGCGVDEDRCWLVSCDVRSCAKEKDITTCGECEEFPCEKLLSSKAMRGRYGKEIMANLKEIHEIGLDAWIERYAQDGDLPFCVGVDDGRRRIP